jgi:hypothetical protein
MGDHFMNPRDYTFRGLCNVAGKFEPEPEIPTSLCYLISCVNAASHVISSGLVARRILSWLYEMEEQARNADHLKAGEKYFDRYFDGGFYPMTPCLVSHKWSPISALLESGNDPVVLNRESRIMAVASGIWNPELKVGILGKEVPDDDQSFFWMVIGIVSKLAMERGMFINVIARPGWSYLHAINSLPNWPAHEVAKSGRVIWRRTFKDRFDKS